MAKINTLEKKIATRITQGKSAVILREDFKDMGDYEQVGRALRRLTTRGKIMRIGYGLYARTTYSTISGKLVPELPLPSLAREALRRLGVETAASSLEKEYKAGRTTQIPTGRMIAVKGRISRKIGYNGAYVSFERIAK